MKNNFPKRTSTVIAGVILSLSASKIAMATSTTTTNLAGSSDSSTGWKKGLSESGLPGGASGSTNTSIAAIILSLMNWLLVILGAIAIIGFVISGIIYLTSAGDTERIERAKRGMIYSIIGVIIGLGGAVIVLAIDKWFQGTGSDF